MATQYDALPWPYAKPYALHTKAQLKKVEAIVLEQMPERTRRISDHLKRAHGVLLTPSSPWDDLDRLPDLIAHLGRMRTMSNGKFEAQIAGARPHAIEYLRMELPRDDLDGETIAMVFDGGLLWGEVFRSRYPVAAWSLGSTRRDDVYYGQPVLTGIDKFNLQFCPGSLLYGAVAGRLLRRRDDWPLTRHMARKAVILGFESDPAEGVVASP